VEGSAPTRFRRAAGDGDLPLNFCSDSGFERSLELKRFWARMVDNVGTVGFCYRVDILCSTEPGRPYTCQVAFYHLVVPGSPFDGSDCLVGKQSWVNPHTSYFHWHFSNRVYPVGMKIMATWTKADRGLAIGLLVGALSLGTASPHLLNAIGGAQNWRLVLLLAAVFAAGGGLIAALFVREGPYRSATPPFNWRYAGEIFRKPDLRLANMGYFGHMWELFGMWAWIAAFLLASFQVSGVNPAWASFAAFSAIGAGGLGSLIAGRLADRFGRTTITISSLAISGLCSLFIGLLFGANPILLTTVALVWGFAIVADSAQYSAAVSELCQKEYTGTALTVQTSLGFLLTLITIRLIPTVESLVGWQGAFAFLAAGPVIGIWAMWSLRRLPESSILAGGKK